MNKDLKKLALMGIISGTVAISQAQAETANPAKTPTRTSKTENNTSKSDNQQPGDVAQSYSNQGYYNNQDQGRGNSYNYYQQNTKRNRSRPNAPSDNNYDQQNPYNNDSDQRYQDMDLNRYNRDKVADNFEKPSSTSSESTKSSALSPDETPPDNLHETSNNEGKFLSKLTSDGKNQFQSLSSWGKMMAKNMAAHDCAGRNDCKGQNACKTAMNQCAGKGNCKGKSSCKVTPDEAVKLSSMLDKRNTLKN